MPYKVTAEQLEQIWEMPPKDHYPNREEKFDFAKSEVIRYLQDTLDVTFDDAKRAFEKFRRSKDILFYPTERVWMGKETFKATFGESCAHCGGDHPKGCCAQDGHGG